MFVNQKVTLSVLPKPQYFCMTCNLEKHHRLIHTNTSEGASRPFPVWNHFLSTCLFIYLLLTGRLDFSLSVVPGAEHIHIYFIHFYFSGSLQPGLVLKAFKTDEIIFKRPPKTRRIICHL